MTKPITVSFLDSGHKLITFPDTTALAVTYLLATLTPINSSLRTPQDFFPSSYNAISASRRRIPTVYYNAPLIICLENLPEICL